MLKKIAVLAAALAVSAPAFADRGHRDHRDHYRGGYGYGKRVVVHKPVHVVHRPVHVVHRPVHRDVVVHHYEHPAPRPVYVVERHHHVNPVAVLAGAVIGAAIVHHVVTGY